MRQNDHETTLSSEPDGEVASTREIDDVVATGIRESSGLSAMSDEGELEADGQSVCTADNLLTSLLILAFVSRKPGGALLTYVSRT